MRSGTGAPPVMKNRTRERSAEEKRTEWTIASSRSGLAKPTLTPFRSMRSKRWSGSELEGTTTVPPLKRTGSTFTPVPPTRKKGAIATVTSSPRMSAHDSTLTTFHVTLPWVSITPLGRPVVPEVYGNMQRSSSDTRSSMSSSLA